MFEPTYPDRELTVERLRFLIRYEPETGKFFRKVSTAARSLEGSECGDIDGKGYIRLRVDGRRYIGHRLAWFYMTGAWPADEVDHINRCRTDNRWCNLRLATKSLNKRNTSVRRNNRVGFKGVSWHKDAKRWRSRIYINGKEKNLGLYDTPEAANAAYEAAALLYFGEFARAA